MTNIKLPNVPTKICSENKQNGLMICGINWGGAESESSEHEEQSFFSDIKVNDYLYLNRLCTWFELFGHPLQKTLEKAGAFERSIIQTNWLTSQSRNMNGKSLYEECVIELNNFEYHINEFKPKLIIFLSVSLLDILNSKVCKPVAEKLFGKSEKPTYIKKDVYHDKGKYIRFRVGIKNFENTKIIALPHPTGSRGLSDAYLAEFRLEISEILNWYKSMKGY
jgi:hypothetical protein